MIRLITSFFGAGLLPKAPGTWGSLAAIPAAWIIHGLGGPIALAIAALLAFFLGWWATMRFTDGTEDHDPGEIVIDEVVGMFITLFPLSAGMYAVGADPWVFPYPGWVLGFIAFRVFDIWKPFPVSWADNLHTPLGVMLDDVFAGFIAGGCVIAIALVAHMVIM